jgi:predicted membrane protein
MDRRVVVLSLVGGARLDLSQAELAAKEVTLTKVSLVGGTRLRVPPGVRVEVSGFSLVGGTRVEAGPKPGPGAPTVHVRAFSLVGGVRVRRSWDV